MISYIISYILYHMWMTFVSYHLWYHGFLYDIMHDIMYDINIICMISYMILIKLWYHKCVVICMILYKISYMISYNNNWHVFWDRPPMVSSGVAPGWFLSPRRRGSGASVSGRARWLGGRQRQGSVAARPLQRGLLKVASELIEQTGLRLWYHTWDQTIISWSSCMISNFISCDIISIGPQHSHCGEAALKHWRHPLAACLVLMVVFYVYITTSQLEFSVTGPVVQL